MRQTYRGVISNPSLIVSSTSETLAAPLAETAAALASKAVVGTKRTTDETVKPLEGQPEAPKGKKRKGGPAN